jgi:hypothetical protein
LISLVLFAIAGLIGLARISSLADGSQQEIQHDRPAGQHEKSTKTSGTSQQHGFRSPA